MNAFQSVTLPTLAAQMHTPLSMCCTHLHARTQQAAESEKGSELEENRNGKPRDLVSGGCLQVVMGSYCNIDQ